MLKESLTEIFERDLNKLKDEINLYKNEGDLWIVKGEISNSAGNLCLHLIGNLNHFIGTVLGGTEFVRNRDQEFASRYVTRVQLNEEIAKTIEVVKAGLDKLTAADFEKDFPVEKRGEVVKMDQMLLHLFGHFSYHLGQINYHRRLLSGD